MSKVTIKLSSVKTENEPSRTENVDEEIVKLDRRLARLQKLKENDRSDREEETTSSVHRNRIRRPFEPEIIEEESVEDKEEVEDVENRHALIRERLINEQIEDEREQEPRESKLNVEEDDDEEEDEESDESSEEDESDEDEEFARPRFKPVFKRKEDRRTINDKQKEAEENIKKEEQRQRKQQEERRKEALRIIESTIQREKIEKDESDANFESINSVKTDDESDEVAYLNWKLREMKRNKRDKEEREAFVREQEEVERLRNMTEEERLAELERNPKVIVNKQEKGKYRFMQKYYHRGAFFLDEEDDIFKRDVAKPTLEDHFDKASLPKVMQVKNFGRSGQTKYTHLVDQDTTDHQSPWYNAEVNQSAKTFYEKHGGGVRQQFERPSKKRKN